MGLLLLEEMEAQCGYQKLKNYYASSFESWTFFVRVVWKLCISTFGLLVSKLSLGIVWLLTGWQANWNFLFVPRSMLAKNVDEQLSSKSLWASQTFVAQIVLPNRCPLANLAHAADRVYRPPLVLDLRNHEPNTRPVFYVDPNAACWAVRLYDTAIHVFMSWPPVLALFSSGDNLPRYCIIAVYKFVIIIEAPDCIIPGTRLSAFWVWRLLCACFYDASAASK